jgi:hypothetical protein
LAFLYFYQEKLIFHPVREISCNPGNLSLNYDDIAFSTVDGVKLNGWFVPAEGAEYTILLCHGNGGNISHRLDTISLFSELSVNLFIFDYRGYGVSGGKISEQGLYADVDAAWRYLVDKRRIPPGKIVIVGRSLGGALAAHAAAEFKPVALVLESAFTSVPDMACKLMPWIYSKHLLKYVLSTLDKLSDVKCPVLVVASHDDRLVPFRMGKKLFAAAPEPKIFAGLTGGHDDCYFLCRDKYKEAFKKILEK